MNSTGKLTIAKASAGAGKTYTLVKTYLTMLFEDKSQTNRHRHTLAVTFTKKATAEMKERILKALFDLSQYTGEGKKPAYFDDLTKVLKNKKDPETVQTRAKAILDDLLQDYSSFMVTTIDSFFQRIMRSFSKELGLSNQYKVDMDDAQIRTQAIDDLLLHLSFDQTDPAVQALRRVIEAQVENNKKWNPRQALLDLSLELFKEVYQKNSGPLSEFLQDTQAVEAYQKPLATTIKNFEDQCLALQKQYKDYTEAHPSLDVSLFRKGLFTIFSKISNKADIVAYIVNGLPANFSKYCNNAETALTTSKKSKAQLAQERIELLPHATEIHPIATALEGLLTGEESKKYLDAVIILSNFPTLCMFVYIAERIKQANEALGRFPISDTNKTLQAVTAGNDTPFIYEKIALQIQHYLLDEFQDTSSMQWDNFKPLVEEGLQAGNSLVVGDIKQSIYRWRNSDYNLLHHLPDQFPTQSETEELPSNYRSCQTVVEFNNSLFCQAGERSLVNPLAEELGEENDLKAVYASRAQEVAAKTPEQGYVQVDFIADKDKNKESDTKAPTQEDSPEEADKRFRDKAVRRLLEIVADLKEKEVPLGEVAVLVRSKFEGSLVANALTQNGYKVISGEALLLTASYEVRFCIAFLRYLQMPEDPLLCTQAKYLHSLCQQLHSEEIDTQAALTKALLPEPLLDETELHQWQTKPLMQIISDLINDKNLYTEQSTAYLQALQDQVYSYSQSYVADVYHFLRWWDSHCDKLAIATAKEGTDAIRIMTIHASKGLEFGVVIVPFTNWKKHDDGRGTIIWAKPNDDYNAGGKIPVLPIKYEAKLQQSAFSQDYAKEKQSQYIDNLNLAYVAFTRAKRALYIVAQQKQYKIERGEETDTETDRSLKLISSNLQDSLLGTEKAQNTIESYKQGEPIFGPDPAQKDKNSLIHTELTIPQKEDARLRVAVSRSFHQSETLTCGKDHQRNYGTLMHALLQVIETKADADKAILKAMQNLIQQGKIVEEDKAQLQAEISKFWALIDQTGHSDWFDGSWTVYNEQSILYHDPDDQMEVSRPDRILLNEAEHKACVIDYKFGEHDPAKYQKQVRHYCDLLTQMGYQTEGYLCYVERGKIEPIVD